MEELIDKIKDLIWEAKVIDPNIIEFNSTVRDACKSNMCGLYNKRWTCPPAVGTLEECKSRCLTYKKALVFTTYGKIEDSFDFEGMLKIRALHDKAQKKVIDRLKDEIGPYMILGAGGCTICKECNYPNPCRHPELKIASVESHGINVVDLSSKLNMKYNNGENTVTYFSILFFKK